MNALRVVLLVTSGASSIHHHAIHAIAASRGATTLRMCSSSSISSISSSYSVGLPIGAVRLPKQQVHSFRLLLDEICQCPTPFRSVETNKNDDNCMVHLPPVVARLLDQGNHTQLLAFLKETNGIYFPGVRKACPSLGVPVEPQLSSCSDLRFVELFAGIGGFRLGLEQIGGRCVLANEVDVHAAAIYRDNFGNGSESCRLAVGDILDLSSSNLPDFDVLVGGFPCQPFSHRGDQAGLDDLDRGQLYREVARILTDCQPKGFLLENVPGLVTLDGGHRHGKVPGRLPVFETGEVFERILDTFRSCGYQVDWRVLNSRRWLPQMRERVYIVGWIPSGDNDEPDEFDWSDLVLDHLEDEVSSTVRDIMEAKESPAVLASALTEQQTQKIHNIQARFGKIASVNSCLNPDTKAPTLISGYHDAGSMTTKYLFEESDGTPRQLPRFLTPRECTRLMGFPDKFNIPVSEDRRAVNQYYRAIGNAVCPPVIAALGNSLRKCIERNN